MGPISTFIKNKYTVPPLNLYFRRTRGCTLQSGQVQHTGTSHSSPLSQRCTEASCLRYNQEVWWRNGKAAVAWWVYLIHHAVLHCDRRVRRDLFGLLRVHRDPEEGRRNLLADSSKPALCEIEFKWSLPFKWTLYGGWWGLFNTFHILPQWKGLQ